MSGGKGDKTCCEKFKNILWKIWKATIDNRRFRMYALAIVKFVTITLIQATETFPKDEDFFYNYKNVFLTLGFCWMGTLCFLFTERYIRELIAIRRKQMLTIWINWVECVVFSLYLLYSSVIGILHFIALSAKVEYYGPTKSAIEFFEVIIVLFIIYEKWTHFLHSGHSISLYLGESRHIPEGDHGHGHDDHGHGGHEGHGDEKHGHFTPLLSDDHTEHGHGHGHDEPKKDHGHGHGHH